MMVLQVRCQHSGTASRTAQPQALADCSWYLEEPTFKKMAAVKTSAVTVHTKKFLHAIPLPPLSQLLNCPRSHLIQNIL
eukprot:6203882-Pleurochrysis_carterae.AAC.2